MGLEEISSEAFEVVRSTAMDHAIWAGAVGSIAGSLIANRMHYEIVPTIGVVLAGHFAGHAVYVEMSKTKAPIGVAGVKRINIPGAVYY